VDGKKLWMAKKDEKAPAHSKNRPLLTHAHISRAARFLPAHSRKLLEPIEQAP
jgi:hypothetical protein